MPRNARSAVVRGRAVETYTTVASERAGMDARRALLVDSFTQEPLAGATAGLVPNAEGLGEAQMRAVAAELGAGETAFLLPSGPADRRVRCFSPTAVVDRPGHSAVAAHVHLHRSGAIAPGEHTLETDVGVPDVSVEPDGRAWVDQGDASVRAADVGAERVAEALDVDPEVLDVDGLPVAVASTGRPYLVVPIRLLSDLGVAEPDGAAVEALADELDVAGIYAFTFDTLDADSALHGRAWETGAGVAEVHASATGSGAVAAYLRRFEAFDALPEELQVEGGHYLDRPGRVFVRARGVVRVGGHAAVAVDGELRVPEVDDGGDIIEG